ncbi:pilus assembly protein [Dietzia sp. CQ4]|uniref:pilus assembly protein n=1 Tax=Dietzia sp. (strain CQ4) TaxID=370437 RepID=UPI0015F963E0|nr:pilus assembly protein [Dietzia sp. CQ4]MBB1033570.1 pilus assembly protein [Dietzia sp. CQ4]
MRSVRCYLTRRLRGRWDAGDVVATVIIFPAIIGFTLLCLQYALVMQARTAANHSAEIGLDSARAQHGSVPLGIAAAQAFANDAGGALRSPVATGTRTGADASITVTGTAISLFPGFTPDINVTRTGPVERITRPGAL